MKKFCLTCDCHDLEHQIWFEYDPDESLKNREIYILTHFRSDTLWKRIKTGLGYIFNNKAGQFSELVRFDKEIAELKDFLQEYRNTK